ncbi:MAG: DUF5660 family protein [Microgenomates group bacterium]
MNQGQSKPNAKRPNPYIVGDNVLETVRSIGGNVGKTLSQDVVQEMGNNMLRDIFGTQAPKELQQNESVAVQPEAPVKQPVSNSELMKPFIQKDIQETKAQLESIRKELQMLSKSIKGFHQEVEKAIMEMPVNPGVYHINFFEQLRSFLQSLRETLDNSSTWLAAFNANSKKKKGYWGKYKKHGTTFGLSSERTASTQSG